MKKAQRIRLGIFIMISLAFLLIILVFFTAQKLLEKKDYYYVAYKDVSVSGLEVGSPVKFLGINVGSIDDIGIHPKDVNTVIVKLSLKSGTPVKEDATADILSLGITGLRAIEIRGGSQDSPFLEEYKYIQAGTSLTDEMTGKAEAIAYRVEEVLNNIQLFTHPDNLERFSETVDKIGVMVDNTSVTFDNINLLITENRSDIREVVHSARQLSHKLDTTSNELFSAIERFNDIMQGDTLAQVLGNFRDISITLRETNLNELIGSLALTTLQTQELLVRLGDDIDRGAETLNQNLMLLQHTLMNLNEASRKINTNPSVLIRGTPSKGTPDQLLDNR
jgi:phospholipid/cholesterol/gamma-HCH transport system substrate-binding protein